MEMKLNNKTAGMPWDFIMFILIINMEFTYNIYISILDFVKSVQHLVINLLVVCYLYSLCVAHSTSETHKMN